MKGGAGATLANLAVAQIHPIRFTCGNYSKGAAVALPDPFHHPPPASPEPIWPMFSAAVEPLQQNAVAAQMRKIPLIGRPVASKRAGSTRRFSGGIFGRTFMEHFPSEAHVLSLSARCSLELQIAGDSRPSTAVYRRAEGNYPAQPPAS
jgi:hypothetical protein